MDVAVIGSRDLWVENLEQYLQGVSQKLFGAARVVSIYVRVSTLCRMI